MPPMPAEWLIVLNVDGTIVAAYGGVPVGWIGTRVDERTDMPAEIRTAAAEARRELVESITLASMASRTIQTTSASVRIVVLHAIGVHRIPTELRALLESTVKLMEPQARGLDVALTLDVRPEVPQVIGLDSSKLAWAITALVGNALRFVRRGTRLMPGGAIQVRARLDPANSMVVLEVQDDGAGIPKDVLAGLLRRLPQQLHVSGLALNLIQDVVAAHGGTVEIESSTQADRSGTTVRLTLPGR